MLGPILFGKLQTSIVKSSPQRATQTPSTESRRNISGVTVLVLLLAMSVGCVQSVPLTPPKLSGVTPVVGSSAAPVGGTPLPTSTPTSTPSATPDPTQEHFQEARSGRDCQVSLLGTFPLNSAPSINKALENAGLTLTTPALQFSEEHLFLGILSRDCIVVFTDESH